MYWQHTGNEGRLRHYRVDELGSLKVHDANYAPILDADVSDEEKRAAMAAAIAGERALGYLQGRQDAGEGGHDLDTTLAFERAYAAHVFGYWLEDRPVMAGVRRAYEEWRESRTIGDTRTR